MAKYTNMKYRTSWANAMRRRMRAPLARARIRKFLRRSIVVRPRSGPAAPIRKGWRRGPKSGFAYGGGINKGNCTLVRSTYTTSLFNANTLDYNVGWFNADGYGQGTLNSVPPGWQLWSNGSYVAPFTTVSTATEAGGSATGAAGEIIRGRIRCAYNDISLPSDLGNWEYIKLNKVVIYFQYQCTDYTAGNDANGLVPTLQYFHDTDKTFVPGTSNEEQDTVAELERRPGVKSIKLPRGAVRSITIYPKVFQVVTPDPAGAFFTGKQVSPGFLDPNFNNQALLQMPISNLQFQIRNIQLPGGTDGTQQTSMIKVWAKYHYTCKNFVGAYSN